MNLEPELRRRCTSGNSREKTEVEPKSDQKKKLEGVSEKSSVITGSRRKGMPQGLIALKRVIRMRTQKSWRGISSNLTSMLYFCLGGRIELTVFHSLLIWFMN